MPFNCHQSVSPYYNNKLGTASNSIRINSRNNMRKTNASSSPMQHHREQNDKLMPGSYSLSQESPASLPLYSCAVASSNKGKVLMPEAFFAQNDNDEMQPLDLSIRPTREEQTVKQPTAEEHQPICLVKSCTCSFRPGHLSPHHATERGVTWPGIMRSPLPGMTVSSSSREGSPMYTQHHMLSSTYHTNSGKATSSSNSVPQTSPWTETEASPFQLLVSSDKVLNGAHNSSGQFRPYNHIHQDMNISSCEETEQDSIATRSNQVRYDEENDEPTYMDLDSTTSVPKAKKDYTGNSGFAYNRLYSLPHISSKPGRNSEGSTEAVCSQYQSPLIQALNSKRGNDFSDTRAPNYVLGGVISHTSFEKSHKKIIGQTGNIPNSEKAAHPKQYLALPDSSVSPATNTHPTTTGQYQDTEGHTGMLPNNYPAYSKTSVSIQHLPSFTTQMHVMQPVSKTPTYEESSSGSDTERSMSNKITSNVQLPVSVKTTSAEVSTSGTVTTSAEVTTSDRVHGNKHKRTGDTQPVTSEQEGNGSTKISLLDFWISKILMERSIEASQPKKTCNVDYICTANGEKRIRLRLVDLMEMQIEQSMKA